MLLKKIIFFIVMISVVLLVCFFTTEYVVRNFYQGQSIGARFDPVLGWRMQPGTYRIKPEHTFEKINFYFNSLGIRNKDISIHENKEVQRIIVLGDSYTFGFAVKFEELFTTKLESILTKNTNHNYEVINAGIPQYGNAQELLMMKELKDHGIVGNIYLLMMFTNDILDNLRMSEYGDLSVNPRQPGFVIDESGHLELRYPPQEYAPPKKEIHNINNNETTRKRENFFNKFESIGFLKERVGTFLQTKPALIKLISNLGFDIRFERMPGIMNAWYRQEILDAGVPLTKALISEMKKETESVNAKLFIVLIPSTIQVKINIFAPLLKSNFPDSKMVMDWSHDPERPQRIISGICKDLDVPYLDLLPVLRANNDKQLFIHGDWHFTAIGHTVVAQGLAKYLEENAVY